MNDKLKPCPFCGGEATIREFACGSTGNGEFSASYEVGCKDCKIKFLRESKFSLINGHPVFSKNGYDECINAWNRRANDEKSGGDQEGA